MSPARRPQRARSASRSESPQPPPVVRRRSPSRSVSHSPRRQSSRSPSHGEQPTQAWSQSPRPINNGSERKRKSPLPPQRLPSPPAQRWVERDRSVSPTSPPRSTSPDHRQKPIRKRSPSTSPERGAIPSKKTRQGSVASSTSHGQDAVPQLGEGPQLGSGDPVQSRSLSPQPAKRVSRSESPAGTPKKRMKQDASVSASDVRKSSLLMQQSCVN